MANIPAHSNIYLEATPNNPNHLVPMQWVIDFVLGNKKADVRVVDVGGLAGTYDDTDMIFTLGAVGELEIDGVTLALGDRVLLSGQTDGTQNGIYVVTVEGDATTEAELTRAPDFNSSEQITTGVSVAVNEGDNFGGTTWKLITSGVIILDSTALDFEEVPPSTLVSKFVGTFTGNNVATSFPINHALGTRSVSVTIRDSVTGENVMIAWTPTDNDTVTINPDVVFDTTQIFEVTVMG
jgi:hypothetical protein